MANFQQTPAGQTATFTFGYGAPGNPVIFANVTNANTLTNITPSRIDGNSVGNNYKELPIGELSDSYTASRSKIAPGWRRDRRVLGQNDLSPSPPGDPYFAYVSLLLHMDGAEGDSGSNVVDFSRNNLSSIGSVGTNISTVQSKFGGSSYYFAAAGSFNYLSVQGPNSGLNFGTGDFTIEAWVRAISQTKNYATIFATGSGGGNIRLLNYGTSAPVVAERQKIGFATAAENPMLLSTTSIQVNQWYHVAVSRQGTTFRLFIDGVLESTATSSTSINFMNSTFNDLYIGQSDWGTVTDTFWNGYIDEVRMTKGICRYTQSFTPEQLAFPNG